MSDDFALDFIHNLKSNESSSNSVPQMSDELKKYLSLLNPEQLQAVEHFGSPLLILAGAGSGKTRVITTKIAYLINQKGFAPYSILAVTFTKKAAKEMLDRAVCMEQRATDAMIKTFHSFGAWFLRRYWQEANIAQNFTVYDDDDMVTLLKNAVPELNKNQAASVAHLISLAKDYCYTPDSLELYKISTNPDFPLYYKLYQERLSQTGNVDFGDLIMLPTLVLEKDSQIRQQMHHRFKVILVDEYQDSNVAQFKLLKLLSNVNPEQNNVSQTYVCVVGDDDQSIYKFRGAEVQNILSFQNQFYNTTLIRLERNYRSTAKILYAADRIVSKNEDRLGKTLIAERGEGKKPVLVFLPNQDEEAKFCASMILESHKAGVPYNDWAILYRTNAQSLTFESEFLHAKIPYQVVGTVKFYEREEIKDMLAFLSLIANQRDEIAFRRIINKPTRGIGSTSQDKIMNFAFDNFATMTIVDAAKQIATSDKHGLSKKAKEGVLQFCLIIDELIQKLPQSNLDTKNIQQDKKSDLSEFVELIMNKSGLLEYHKDQDQIAGTQRVLNMQELVNSAVLYENSTQGLLDFLDHIELDRTLETGENATDSLDLIKDSVTLITLHNTKGLEFPRVIITGLEKGIFPRDAKDDLQEERRLFYVGITRAKDELYVTSCAVRRMFGHINPMEPSPFLMEMGQKPFRVLGNKPYSYVNAFSDDFSIEESSNDFDNYKSDNSFNAESINKSTKNRNAPWSIGTKIFHDDYGYGQIIKSDIIEENLVINVAFETGSVKKFLPNLQKSSLMIIKDE